MRAYFHQKIPGLICLLTFATLMSGILMIYPQANLTGSVSDVTGSLFTALTHSAGNPGFLITVSLLLLIPIARKSTKQEVMKVTCQFAILLIMSFATKTTLKHITEVARPYTYELQALNLIDSPESFYALDQAQKDKVVELAQASVSHWRIAHWQGETNYSLPSGHSIFAAVCIAFWGGYLLRRKHWIATAAIITWGIGVGFSRIWLGMHWPSDIIASILAAALLYLFTPEFLNTPLFNPRQAPAVNGNS